MTLLLETCGTVDLTAEVWTPLTERAHVESSGSNHLQRREEGVITPIHLNSFKHFFMFFRFFVVSWSEKAP